MEQNNLYTEEQLRDEYVKSLREYKIAKLRYESAKKSLEIFNGEDLKSEINDPLEIILSELFELNETESITKFYQSKDILELIPKNIRLKYNEIKIGMALKKMGYTRIGKRLENGVRYGYMLSRKGGESCQQN